jgi:hypothetical protein
VIRAAAIVVIALAVTLPSAADAQNSVYGVLGIGFVGRPLGTRARGTAGGLGAVDQASGLNPATVAAYRSVSVNGSIGTTLRSYTALGASADGLTETRAPFAQLAGWIRGTPVSFGITYSTYADRTYNLVTVDTISIDGSDVEVSDRIFSDGAVADIGGSLAARIGSRIGVGVAVHLLTGSTKAGALREFSDPTYRPAAEEVRLGFNGAGLAVGLMVVPHPRLSLAAAFRTDSRLETVVDSTAFSKIQLPMTFTGGMMVIPHRVLHWATTFTYQTWSDAAGDLAATSTVRAFDTWEVSSGFEIGGPGVSPIPLRLGFRYANLPFSPSDDQPRELAFAAGTGLGFASDRGRLDFSVERIRREGAGAKEDAWYLTFAVTVRP